MNYTRGNYGFNSAKMNADDRDDDSYWGKKANRHLQIYEAVRNAENDFLERKGVHHNIQKSSLSPQVVAAVALPTMPTPPHSSSAAQKKASGLSRSKNMEKGSSWTTKYPWAAEDAKRRTAGFVYGPLEVLLPALESWDYQHHKAKADGLTHIVAIPLGQISRFFTKNFSLHEELKCFTVGENDAPVYCAREGVIENLTCIKPSKHTSLHMNIGDRKAHQDILRRLSREHPDYYILGVKYEEINGKGGDVQPYISETAEPDELEEASPSKTMFRGIQEELQITLSDAQKDALAGAFSGPYGYSKSKIDGHMKSIVWDVVIPITHGLGIDYTPISPPTSKISITNAAEVKETIEVTAEKVVETYEDLIETDSISLIIDRILSVSVSAQLSVSIQVETKEALKTESGGTKFTPIEEAMSRFAKELDDDAVSPKLSQ